MKKEVFLKMMESEKCIALATSVEEQPNVRIVNFIYDQEGKRIQFASFKGNPKTHEFKKNNKVAFTLIPEEGTSHIKGKGVVCISHQTIHDVSVQFIGKIPEYAETIKFAGEQLELYDIKFDEVTIIEDMNNIYNYIL